MSANETKDKGILPRNYTNPTETRRGGACPRPPTQTSGDRKGRPYKHNTNKSPTEGSRPNGCGVPLP